MPLTLTSPTEKGESQSQSQSPPKESGSSTKDGAKHSNSNNTANANKKSRLSSFFRLNQQSHKTIPQLTVSLQDVTYRPVTASAKAKAQPRRSKANRSLVLEGIHTQIHPYQLNGWMGPSGSGKTSLISVAAGLVDPQDVTGGSILVNGQLRAVPKQQVGVVWQDDLLLNNLTVEETIYFAARLKTPSTISDGDVRVLVEETIKELGLWQCRKSLIGGSSSTGAGISGGERKRTAVAVELVVRPPLLLCDEPTSGLDATTAHSLMKTLKELASLGHSIVVVIHQPRTDIFKLLDHLLLLSRGKVVYDGPAPKVRSYLEGLPSIEGLPPETGIADWIMDTIIHDERNQHQQQNETEAQPEDCENKANMNKDNTNGDSSISSMSLADYWAKHRLELRDTKEPKNASVVDGEHPQQSLTAKASNSKYEASFGKELSMLTARISKQQRGNKLTLASLLLTLTYLAFTNFLYWRLPDDTSNVYERNSLIFFLLIAQGMGIVTTSIAVFHRERKLFRRERAKKLYRVLPFFLAKLVSDSTNNIVLPFLYGAIMYWTAGLRPSPAFFVKFCLAYYLSLCCAQSMGFCLSVAFPNMGLAMILAPPLTLFMFIAAGFYIPFHNLNAFMKWLSYVSFARYGYSALLVNEYEARVIPCPDDDLEFVGITIGGDSCPLPGEAVYESIGLNGVFASYWFNVGILAMFQIVFLVGAYGLLRRSK